MQSRKDDRKNPAASGEVAEWLALDAVPGVGSKTFSCLLSAFGSPLAAMQAPVRQLLAVPRMTRERAAGIRAAARRLDYYAAVGQSLARAGIKVILSADSRYPAGLRELDAAPPLLFVRGDVLPSDRQAVALIGSSRPSPAGVRLARLAASEAAEAGYTVVSGYARGIDTAAHAAALKSRGRTIAVLPTGICRTAARPDAPAPSEIARNGALVSQFLPDERWHVGNAMARNKLIVALSRFVVVIETQYGPGIRATCQAARKLGRGPFLFCHVPGSPARKACQNLLADGGHKLASLKDFRELLRGRKSTDPREWGLFDLSLRGNVR